MTRNFRFDAKPVYRPKAETWGVIVAYLAVLTAIGFGIWGLL